jgi:hypothetical protein
MNVLKKTLIGAGFGAIVAMMGSSAAMAAPIFTVNPNSIPGASGSVFNADAFTFTSSARIVQGATTQTEAGFAYLDKYTLNGAQISSATTDMSVGGDYAGTVGSYGVYFTFNATVSGVTGLLPSGGIGTIDSFSFSMYADRDENTSFNPCTFGTACVVGGTTSDDILLATGTLQSGNAGFDPTTGAPTFGAIDFFSLSAAGSAYFTNPVPFYPLVLTTTTGASFLDVKLNATGDEALLNGFTGRANFIPEPLTLSLFGVGLAGAAALRRRKSKKA